MNWNRKRLVSLGLAVLLTAALSGCGGSGAATSNDAMNGKDGPGTEDTAAQELEPAETLSAAILDTQPEELVKFNWIGMDDQHLYRAMGCFLEYYDFGQQAWRSLCSSPNCDHSTERCGAYVGDVTWVDCTTPYEGKIYYLRCMDLNQVSLCCFDPAAQTHTEICQVEPLGDFSGSSTTSYIRDGIFFYLDAAIIGEGTQGRSVARILQIDLDTGKAVYSSEFGQDYALMGVYQDQLIGINYSDPTESEAFDPDAAATYEGGYYAYLDTIPVTLTLYTMPFGEENATWTAVWAREDAGGNTIAVHNACYGNYFLVSDGPEVSAVDILTGEEHSIVTAEGVMASLESVIGNELFWIDISEISEDGTTGTMTKCVLDLSTGELYRLGETTGTGSPFLTSGQYFLQESVQYIAKEDYYLGRWDRWISLV